jgi:AcrR family transcriptional regulator
MSDGRFPMRSVRSYRMTARAAASEATERNIRDAAVRLFGELPYDQVSLQAVADRAGVTVQTVLRRFSSKEELFAAAAERMTRQIQEERDVVSAGDVGGGVANTIETYERWGDRILNLLAQELRTPSIREVTNFGRRHHYGWVEHVFRPLLMNAPADVRSQRVAQLIAITDLYVWKVLRRDLKLSRDDTEAAVRDLVDRMMRPT